MKSTYIGLLAAALALTAAGLVHAQQPAATASAPAAPVYAEGEVRKIDRDAGKVTIRHGEIRNLEMPPMTMVFAVRDQALLDRVKTGDRIRFSAVDIGGKLTVVEVQPGQ